MVHKIFGKVLNKSPVSFEYDTCVTKVMYCFIGLETIPPDVPSHRFHDQFWFCIYISISHMCLTGTVVAAWTLTQEVVDLNPFTVMTNIFSH